MRRSPFDNRRMFCTMPYPCRTPMESVLRIRRSRVPASTCVRPSAILVAPYYSRLVYSDTLNRNRVGSWRPLGDSLSRSRTEVVPTLHQPDRANAHGGISPPPTCRGTAGDAKPRLNLRLRECYGDRRVT